MLESPWPGRTAKIWLVRELQLLGVDEHNHESAAIAEEIRGLLVSPTHARVTARRAAEKARDDHLDFVDIEMAMPREFGVLVEQLQWAVERADRLCEEGRLLRLRAEMRVLENASRIAKRIRGAARARRSLITRRPSCPRSLFSIPSTIGCLSNTTPRAAPSPTPMSTRT